MISADNGADTANALLLAQAVLERGRGKRLSKQERSKERQDHADQRELPGSEEGDTQHKRTALGIRKDTPQRIPMVHGRKHRQKESG